MSEQETSTSARYIHPQPGDAWAADAAAQGKTGTQRLLAVETIPAPLGVQRALQLGEGEDVVVRRRLILADDKPVELADSYYPASIAAGTKLAEAKKIKGGAIAVLAERGVAPADFVEVVSARPAEPDEAEALEVAAAEPLLVLARISRPVDGPPVEYAVNRMLASEAAPLVYRMRAS